MESIIESLILNPKYNIRVGNCFDSHLIIKLLIENYSDDYFKFICNYTKSGSKDIATFAHGQIGREIRKLSEGNEPILEQLEPKSVSFNIHNKISPTTLWKRIK